MVSDKLPAYNRSLDVKDNTKNHIVPHRTFITYHHDHDQDYKDELIRIGTSNGIFIDGSVDTDDISDDLSDERIREIVRDEYLRDTTVTILLVGGETRYRKHVDWETYSSMYDGAVNKKSGLIVVNLPYIGYPPCYAPHGTDEHTIVYPEISEWFPPGTKEYYELTYPYMPTRIIDNLVDRESRISVTNWDRIIQLNNLSTLIELAFRDRAKCKYNMSRPLRRRNGP